MSRSLESILSGHRPRANTTGLIRVDQHGRLMPPAVVARSVVTQPDTRRFSEASINPPPRPPPPNLKRFNVRSQRKPAVPPPPGTSWPPQMMPSALIQTQPQPQPSPQQGIGASNLAKSAHLARSSPQLDDHMDGRERDRERTRERDKSPHVQNTKESLIAQVTDAVHGVTTEEVHNALQRNDWNPHRAEQQLKLGQLYSLSLCSRDDCLRILSKYQWNLEHASRYLIRSTRDDRPGDRERPPVSTDRRV